MKPYYEDKWVTQYCSDALNVLPKLESESVDLLVTDPPYGISFMGKSWDKALPDKEIWQECLRVLKPGAFAFVMSIPRSDCLSRMIISLEDAGFRVDFTPIYWAYASGFPKAQNIGKAVDKKGGQYLGWFIDYILKVAEGKGISRKELTMILPSKSGKPTGWLHNKQYRESISVEQYNVIKDYLNLPFASIEEAEREVIGVKAVGSKECAAGGSHKWGGLNAREINITLPSTYQAKALDGSYGGFQPKPAVEVIIVCMKPLSEKTFVDQALKNGKGITWLDDCRIPYESEGDHDIGHHNKQLNVGDEKSGCFGANKGYGLLNADINTGRFPANLLVSDDVLNDERVRKSGKDVNPTTKGNDTAFFGGGSKYYNQETNYGDSGSFSRYFDLDKWAQKTFPFLIVSKASRSEKERGLDDFPERKCRGDYKDSSQFGLLEKIQNSPRPTAKNFHPTVKPLKLMSYLITLGSRSGDTVIDPFGGSGTTALAAKMLGRKCIGIEIEEKYCEIAANRCRQSVMELNI